jgi:hypothetical protein
VRFAKSAGSALKFWGDAALPNGVALGLLIFLTYAVLVELNYIRDPAKVPAPEVFEVTSELPDAPLYR